MRFYIPKLLLATALPRQTAPQDKFGGLPWGLPPERWPICAGCGGYQSLLAQLGSDVQHFDLGPGSSGLLIFQCENGRGCATFNPESGCNAVLFLAPGEEGSWFTPSPNDNLSIVPEARIVGWVESEDRITPAEAEAFMSHEAFFDLDEDLVESVSPVTRMGSVPAWIQSPQRPEGTGWRFMFQLDCEYVLSSDPQGVGVLEAMNFGDSGRGYLFLRTAGSHPEGRFLWQCS